MSTHPASDVESDLALVAALLDPEPPVAGSHRARLRAVPDPSHRATPAPVAPRSRFVLASLSLTGAVVLLVVGAFLALQMAFPWMTLRDQDTVSAAAAPPPTAGVHPVAASGPSPAERVLDTVIGTDLPAFADWTATKPTSTVASPSLGFGCDPKDGLSPVTGRTRSWIRGTGSVASSALTVSVRAYPAGGGAVALDGIAQAALDCDAAMLGAPGIEIGVEAITVSSRRTSALIWRRGDVLVLAAASTDGSAGSPTAYADSLTRLDAALATALDGVCADPTAGADQAVRSPYLDRDGYRGRHVAEEVRFARSPGQRTAEQRATVPVVAIPAPAATLPDLGALPVAPVPAPTTGPAALPVPVPIPTLRPAPVRPALSAEVPRAVADPAGPGCGWDFTAQQPPVFDASAAATAYDKAVDHARTDLAAAWDRWQHARLAYFRAYADYRDDVASYTAYAAQVATIRAAWAVIDQARADYATAYANWEDATAARDAWQTARDQARADFKASKQACRDLPAPEPSPTEPTGSPSAQPSSTPTPTAEPTPAVECPPVRPAILDETAPSVPPSPTPAAEAQLP